MRKSKTATAVSKHPPARGIRQALKGRSRRDLLAILEVVETLVRAHDWNGLTELFSED